MSCYRGSSQDDTSHGDFSVSIGGSGKQYALQFSDIATQDPRGEYWPAAGFVDTKLRCFTKLEVGYGEAHFQS